MSAWTYPDGKRFAFTVIDDTDGSRIGNTKPIYDFLSDLGMRTTKTVWPVDCPEGSHDYGYSQTLEDEDYLAFVHELKEDGFEIAFHGATMESSTRERTLRALDLFREHFGENPKIHVNHAANAENLYWGERRIDEPMVRWLFRRLQPKGRRRVFHGHDQKSEYFWGDLAQERTTYVRNLTFGGMNVLRHNPTMPYRDPDRPYAPWWFSTNEADDWRHFATLLKSREQERLEREGGVCIVTTHFGKGFTKRGKVQTVIRDRLEELARRPGWFVPAGELLDWLREQQTEDRLSRSEWKRMQRRWILDLILKHLQNRALGPEWWKNWDHDD